MAYQIAGNRSQPGRVEFWAVESVGSGVARFGRECPSAERQSPPARLPRWLVQVTVPRQRRSARSNALRRVGAEDCGAAGEVPWAVSRDTAVRLTFGIPLARVGVTHLPTPAPNGPRSVSRTDYFYGPIRRDYGRQDPSPIALWIQEGTGRANTSRFQHRLTHPVCGQKAGILQAALNHPYRPYGPWYLVVNFPHGNRSLGIVGNTGKQRLETLACRIIQNH